MQQIMLIMDVNLIWEERNLRL